MVKPGERDQDRGDVIEEIIAECLARPEAEWRQAIEAACLAHPQHASELRERFELLRTLGIKVLLESRSAPELPERLGEFRLLRQIGAGGMETSAALSALIDSTRRTTCAIGPRATSRCAGNGGARPSTGW
jgi:hypothetical protein